MALVMLATVCAMTGWQSVSGCLLPHNSVSCVRSTRDVAMGLAAKTLQMEAAVLQLAANGRPGQEIEMAAAELVASGGGYTDPAFSPFIEGEWRLVHLSSSDFDLRNPLGERQQRRKCLSRRWCHALSSRRVLTTRCVAPGRPSGGWVVARRRGLPFGTHRR